MKVKTKQNGSIYLGIDYKDHSHEIKQKYIVFLRIASINQW